MVTSIVFLLALVKVLARRGWPALMLFFSSPSFGGIVSTGSSVVFSGTSGNGLSARATFTVDPGDTNVLRLLLENTSPSTMSPPDLLASAYFNVLSGTTTGSSAPLTCQSASGQVYLALKTLPDKAAFYVPPTPPSTTGSTSFPLTDVPPSNLQAVNPGDNTWQFRSSLSLVASQPPLAFGVGTVGNNSFAPNNFNGNIVDGFDFGIYVGDVTTQNLNDTLLVKDAIRFEFSGFKNFTLSQVAPHMVFGFGTTPASIITVPEPGTLSLATFGLIAALLTARRLRWRPAVAGPRRPFSLAGRA